MNVIRSHSGARRRREPGIHNKATWLHLDSEFAAARHPGMTTEKVFA